VTTTRDLEPHRSAPGLSEAEGRALLLAKFTDAGFAIEADVVVNVDGHLLTLDGYDASARVGYEYLTEEAEDAREFTPAAVAALEATIAAGRLALLLVDEYEALTADALGTAADGFLTRVVGPKRASRGA
jgi:hypothetical protein